jgi:hypothetical protein
MADKPAEVWDLWYPNGGATGIPFARSRIDPVEVVFVHASPQVLEVTVRDQDGKVKAVGKNLTMTDDTPITRLRCTGSVIEREDIWPGPDDIGRVVILPGGEAGILMEWWHAPDHSEWRWQIELYNRRSG